MHKLLARQVKRFLDLPEVRLPVLLQELEDLASRGEVSAEAGRAIAGLSTLLERVSETYSQNDRDLELKTRSLELSSLELTEKNERLRNELVSRTRAIDSLRKTARDLMVAIDAPQTVDSDDSLESLSILMRDLVVQHEESQSDLHAALTDLAYQKFALDQHAIVSITNLAGDITYANDKLCEISGFSRGELIGKNHRIIDSGIQPRAFFANLWETIVNGQVWHGEICNRSKNGHTYWVDATVVPLRDELGKPTMYIAIQTDLTERKRMESEVQSAEARLRRITNTVPGVVFQWHVGGPDRLRYTFVSDRLQELRGLSVEQLLADPELATQQIIELDRARVVEGVTQAALGRQGWQDDYRVLVPGLGQRWLRAEISPEPNLAPDGAVVFTGIWQDVTLIKEADQRLREVTENVPVAVFQYVLDEPGALQNTFVSQAIQVITGVPAEEMIADASKFWQQVHPDDIEQVQQSWAKAHRDGQKWVHDYRMLHRETKSTVWIHTEHQPRSHGNGRTTWNGYLADVTQARVFSEELRQAKDLAEAASKAKSDFLANMSHEIRTPMNGVIGMTDLLLETNLEPDQREYLGIVKSSSEALLRIINDILDFSKIEAGKLLIEAIPYQLDVVLADTLKTLALRARQKGLVLGLEIAEDVPPMVVGDPGRLRQVVVNLVGNAIKFTQHGEVMVRVQRGDGSIDGRTLQISVSDTGIGIPSEKLDSVFEAFSQEDSSITRRFGGTGLGLAICARLVAAMGGRIWVQSDVGKGSVFLFTTQVEIDRRSLSPRDTSAGLTPDLFDEASGGLRVLLAEDDVINQKLAVTLLQRWGHQVTVAENGQIAIDLLALHEFDVILMDMMMPVLDGLETARRIRASETGRRKPIIAMTANAQAADRERCLQAGMDDYISKPIKAKVLQQLLQSLMVNPSLHPPLQPSMMMDIAIEPDGVELFDYRAALLTVDQEILDIVEGPFEHQWPTDLERMQLAVVQRDFSQIRHIAHALKGTLAIFGAQPASDLALSLENSAQRADFDAVCTFVPQLEQEVERMLEACLERREAP